MTQKTLDFTDSLCYTTYRTKQEYKSEVNIMTIKEFEKLCKEHNAMDYAMVIANSRAKEEYPFTARNLKVNSDLENIEIHFSMKNKLMNPTNDYMTVEEFLKWAGSFKNYGIKLEDVSYTWVNKSDVKFWNEDKVVQLYFI